VGAYYYLEHYQFKDEEASFFVSSRSPQGLEIRKKVFNSDDETLLEAYTRAPGIRPHSVLHFTEGASVPYYTVGMEGVRYLSSWSDETVGDLLSAKEKHIFVFGGSTTVGHGVPDDDTVVAYLNRFDKDNVYLNFGIQAYDSIREIDKLIYLIQNMLHALAYSFPVTHVIKRWIEGQRELEHHYERKSANIHGMEGWQELMRYHYKWPSIHIDRANDLAEDVVQYYKEAIAFVRALGKAFGFVPHFIYQPIGLLESNQPFLAENLLDLIIWQFTGLLILV
jgi:hypothetical protein